MRYYIHWLSGLVLIAGACLFIFAQPIEAISYTVRPGPVGCVQTFNAGQQLNGQSQIRFYNACPERLYINVCVLDTNDQTKLYKSGSRIMTNGNFTIMTFPDQLPKLVAWTADPYQALIPDLCNPPPKTF